MYLIVPINQFTDTMITPRFITSATIYRYSLHSNIHVGPSLPDPYSYEQHRIICKIENCLEDLRCDYLVRLARLSRYFGADDENTEQDIDDMGEQALQLCDYVDTCISPEVSVDRLHNIYAHIMECTAMCIQMILELTKRMEEETGEDAE